MKLLKSCLCMLLLTEPLTGQAIINAEDTIPVKYHPLFKVVAADVYAVVIEMFHGRPPLDLPVFIYHSEDFPRTSLNDWSHPMSIRIGTTVTQGNVDVFTFQFAHEMGHVMLDPRRNSGFADAVCAALSLEILARLSAKWRTSPPTTSLRGFDLLAYRHRVESEMMPEFPPEIAAAVKSERWTPVAAYLRAHRHEMEPSTSPSYRQTQLLAALSILSKPVDWESLKGIAGCTDPSPEQQPTFQLLPIAKTCMNKVRDIDCRVGADCQP